jgi:hypothetical protein
MVMSLSEKGGEGESALHIGRQADETEVQRGWMRRCDVGG